jgi:Family of unknown function (DUF6161)
MTNSELKKKVAESPNNNWLKNIRETLDFVSVGIKLEFEGVTAIYEYVNQQVNGWKQYEKLPNEFTNVKNYFEIIRDRIIHFINTNSTRNENYLDGEWQTIRSAISDRSHSPIPYNLPIAEFLVKIYMMNSEYYSGAYACLIGQNFNIHNKQTFIGGILAYEFLFKDNSEIVERRSVEKKSIEKLKSDFLKYLNESEALLLEHLKDSGDKYTEYVDKIDKLKSDKDTDFTNWFNDVKKDKWQDWYNPTVQKIKDLENTYREKLKLEEPAKYWKDRSKELKKQGWIALTVLIILVLTSALSLGKILWASPEQIYISWFNEDKSAAIRWSIVYITLISFIAFCVRAVTKVMFSSFHLARDCEERHTLTYFYLSLLKDSKLDEKDRQLIIQSLFSRAETGLLRDDASPTMPNDIISRITSK